MAELGIGKERGPRAREDGLGGTERPWRRSPAQELPCRSPGLWARPALGGGKPPPFLRKFLTKGVSRLLGDAVETHSRPGTASLCSGQWAVFVRHHGDLSSSGSGR